MELYLKRIARALLFNVLLVALAGCGGQTNTADTATNTPEPPQMTEIVDPVAEQERERQEQLDALTELYQQNDFLGVLQTADRILRRERTEEIDELVSRSREILLEPFWELLHTNYDEIDGRITYRPEYENLLGEVRRTLQFRGTVQHQPGGRTIPTLFITIGFFRDNWLFFERITITGNDVTINLSPSRSEIRRQTSSDHFRDRGIFESVSHTANRDYDEFLNMLRGDGNITVRFRADGTHLDHTVVAEQRQYLLTLLEFFQIYRLYR